MKKIFGGKINHDIKHTFFNNLFKVITGPLSMILIPLLLTKQMQGYWYSFMSISALTVLADLGFTTIILQFSAHEFAHLSMDENMQISGSKKHFDRIASLFRFITRWGTVTSAVSFPLIFLTGFIIFSGEKVDFHWLLPWIVYLIGAAMKFYLNILLSYFEGCGLLGKIQKLKSINIIFSYVLNVTLLLLGFHLYALAISMFIGAAFFVWQIYRRFKPTIKQLLNQEIVYHSWRSEVFSLLWRYTISWFSGYLMFNLFTPFAFKYYGSKFAGQVGITDTLVTAIFALANAWIYAINPKMNMLVSQKNWVELDKLFNKNMLKSVGVFCFFSISALVMFYLMSIYFPSLSNRFLSLGTIALLLGAWLLQLIINTFAIYSRAHKEEPYVISSLVAGLYILIVTFYIVNYHPPQYLYYGFFTSFAFTLPWFYYIYRRRKKILHS